MDVAEQMCKFLQMMVLHSDDLVFQQYDGNEVMTINERQLFYFDDGGEHISSACRLI